MRKTLFLISLLVALLATSCSDGLDNIEYNGNSDVVVATAQVTATTGVSLTVKSSITGNMNNVVKKIGRAHV